MSPDVLVTGALGTRSAQGRGKAERSEPEKTAARLGELVAITSIAEKIGCAAETLRSWVRQAERDQGKRPGPPSVEGDSTLGG